MASRRCSTDSPTSVKVSFPTWSRKIIDEFDTVEKQEPTAQVVDSMTALADALDAVRGEQTSRVTAQKELETRAAEAASRVRQVKPGEEEEVDPNADPSAVEDAPAPVEPAEAPPRPRDRASPGACRR